MWSTTRLHLFCLLGVCGWTFLGKRNLFTYFWNKKVYLRVIVSLLISLHVQCFEKLCLTIYPMLSQCGIAKKDKIFSTWPICKNHFFITATTTRLISEFKKHSIRIMTVLLRNHTKGKSYKYLFRGITNIIIIKEGFVWL